MKINDPRLTAFVLGELNADDSRAVKNAMHTDKAIAEEISAIEDMVALVSEGYSSGKLKLTAEQRGKVYSSGTATNIEDIASIKARSAKLTWWSAGIGVAAAVALLLTLGPSSQEGQQVADFSDFSSSELTERMGVNTKSWGQAGNIVNPASASALETALSQYPGHYKLEALKGSGTVYTHSGEQKTSLPYIQTLSQSSSILPLTSGVASPDWVRNAIANGTELQPSMVRTEELINAIDLPIEPTYSTKGLASSLELLPCPWDRNALIAAIHFENTNQSVLENVSAGIQVSSAVQSYQIIGYTTGDKSSLDTPEKLNMEPGYQHSVLVELQFDQAPSSNDSLVTLHLSVNETQESIRYGFDETFISIPSKRSSMATAIAAWAKLYEEGTPRGAWFADVSDTIRSFTFSSNSQPTRQLAEALLRSE